MKKLIFFILTILCINACQKDTAPQMEITISTTASTKWKTAQFDISDFSFLTQANDSSAEIGGSILQQWEGALFEQDLTNENVSVVTNDEHWAMDLIGVLPYMSITLVDIQTDDVQRVNIPSNLMIAIDPIRIEENQSYQINIRIDTDAAFQENDNAVILNWSNVDATVIEL